MNGQAIAAQAVADAGLRQLASEQGGPRAAGARAAAVPGESRTALAPPNGRAARATRP